MTAKRTASLVSTAALASALTFAAVPLAAAASSCSCTMREMCMDATSKGPNAVCDRKKCSAGAKFSAEACPKKDLVATCSMKGPDYVIHNRFYAPMWKLETVKVACAEMKGELSPASR